MAALTITEFIGVLGKIGLMRAFEHAALEKAAVIVETEAKRVIGTYDYSWTPLAPSTIARKATGDSPLLETGELRESIEHNVDGLVANIGSNNMKAVWHELGTSRVPPRSFLVQAAVHKEKEVVHLIERDLVLYLSQKRV
jgi:phage gpG-like protein